MALAGAPAALAQTPATPLTPSSAATAARALLNGPRPATPITEHAGMGTADPPVSPRDAVPMPRAAAASVPLPSTGGIDGAGNGEGEAAPARTIAPPIAPAVSPAQVAAPVVPTPRAPSATPVRAGIDAAGDGVVAGPKPAPVQASAAPAATAPAATAPATNASAATIPAPAAAAAATAPATPGAAPANKTPLAAPAAQVVTLPAAPAPLNPVPSAPQAPTTPVQASGAAVPGPVVPGATASGAASPLNPVPGTPAAGTVAEALPPIPAPLAPVAEAVVALLAQPEGFGSTKQDNAALQAFYTARQGLPLLVNETGLNGRGAAVEARLAVADDDGLDPADYTVALPARDAGPGALAEVELRLAAAALTYARHAQSGRFTPSRISSLVTPTRDIPDPAQVLTALAEARDANATLAAYNPPHAGYRALKAKLAEMDRPRDPAQVMIPPGGLLKPGESDPRVPTLRARLGLPGIPGDLTYDAALVEAVKAFQVGVKLKPTGVVGQATVVALNRQVVAPSADLRADVIANMERWRWLPRNLGAAYVWVNIPEYMARIVQDGQTIHETRIVVGKPDTPTPLLTQDMQYAVVNPAWNIPASIARKEMMPLLRSDPDALSRRGIEVVRSGSGGYTFRQVPGAKNALGRIKFMFPNDHAVYLHDTPSRSLFERDKRAFSHGCMRVQDPLEFGEVLFSIGLPDAHLSAERLGKMFGGKERYITLKQRIPVHVVYFTTVVEPDGRLRTFEDLYGINAEVEARLGLDGKRRLADGAATSRR